MGWNKSNQLRLTTLDVGVIRIAIGEVVLLPCHTCLCHEFASPNWRDDFSCEPKGAPRPTQCHVKTPKK